MLHNDAPCGRKGPNALPYLSPILWDPTQTSQPNRVLVGPVYFLYYRTWLTVASPSDSWPSFSLDHARASVRPRSTSTPASTGSAAQSIATRNKKAYRMFPVKSATRPTTRGPMKDEDCWPRSQINERSTHPRNYEIRYTYLIGDGEQAVPSCLLPRRDDLSV